MISIVVFDCDGTLVDCSRMIALLRRGYHRLYPQRPRLPYAHFVPCYSMSTAQMLAYLHVPMADADRLSAAAFGSHGEYMQDTELFERIPELFHALHAAGIRLGINTSRDRATFDLLKTQLNDAYDLLEDALIITSEQLTHPKPHPQSLFLLQQRSGCRMEEILFVGDSSHDAACAEAAGCPFAYALWGTVHREEVPCRYRVDEPWQLLELVSRENR